MNIQEISVDKLRRMEDQEGLVIQGCGGDLQDWVNGINEMLTQEGILKKGAQFADVYSFRHGRLSRRSSPTMTRRTPFSTWTRLTVAANMSMTRISDGNSTSCCETHWRIAKVNGWYLRQISRKCGSYSRTMNLCRFNASTPWPSGESPEVSSGNCLLATMICWNGSGSSHSRWVWTKC